VKAVMVRPTIPAVVRYSPAIAGTSGSSARKVAAETNAAMARSMIDREASAILCS
jgi:hypothetical protein